MKIQVNIWTLISLAIVLCALSIAHGQQDQNALALRHYTWKSQTQIRKEGEVKATTLYSNRYAADGTVVQLLLEEESAKLPKFGLRGMVAKKKKQEAQELIEALQALAKSYGELPPAKLQAVMTSARAALETNAPQPLLRLESGGVLQPGDSMIVWIDANTRRKRRIEINTSFNAKPVRIVTEFKDLPHGPTYLARSVVNYPHEELTLTVENFDYEHLAMEDEAQD